MALILVAVSLAAASLFYRNSKGKPIFLPRFTDVTYKETWRSGHSDRRFASLLAQAPGILWIVIDRNRLQVGPHFPFNLALVAELLGWDHVVPGHSILEVKVVSSGVAAEAVAIRYRHLTGDEETLQLHVQDRAAFLAALTKIRRHQLK